MSNSDNYFLVEFANGQYVSNFQPLTVTPFTENNGGLIHIIDTSRPSSSTYWTDWGGTYDNPSNPFAVIFLGEYLQRVDSLGDLLLFEYASFVDGDLIYIHTPSYPWQVPEGQCRIDYLSGYSSAVGNPLRPSDNKIGGIPYPNRFSVPSLPSRLSDPLNGVNLSPTFRASMINNDGFFDLLPADSILNGPIDVLRSSEILTDAQGGVLRDSFKVIRRGKIENSGLTLDTFSLEGADFLRTLDEPVTRTLKEYGYSNSDEFLPIIYGRITDAPLIRVDEPQDEVYRGVYVVCDPDYLSRVNGVYNSDGALMPNWTLGADGSITITWSEGDSEPEYCDVSGEMFSTIGHIILIEMRDKSGYPIDDSYWNLTEAIPYQFDSPQIYLYFEEGTVRELISKVLKSDMAYVIQQSDGRLTIRRWNQKYTSWPIASSLITQPPKKVFSDFKYFTSSTKINYNYNAEDDGETFIDDSQELSIFSRWKKKARLTYETNLTRLPDVQNLSEQILRKFGRRSERWDVSVGQDISDIQLLDSVPLIISVNGRRMSLIENWKVVGVDPAQDVLTLEEDTSYTPESRIVPLSHPVTSDESGFLSQPVIYYEEGLLSEPVPKP